MDGKGFINARAETLDERPSFSESFRFRRCLIPADGFFEWKRTGREKRPYHFQLRDEGPLMFAEIWDTWRTRTETITTCAIITTPANALVGELHDRMPAILPLEVQEAWLDRRTNRADLPGMLTPYSASRMKSYPVTRKLNSPDFDDAELLFQVNNEVGTTPSLF